MLDVIPQVNLQDFTSNGSQRQKTFVQTIGDALAEIGFFVLAGHGVDTHLISRCYNHAATFFNLPEKVKDTYDANLSSKLTFRYRDKIPARNTRTRSRHKLTNN